MKSIDSGVLITLSKVFSLVEDVQAAALLAVCAHPTDQHKDIASRYDLHPKAITRATAAAEAAGILHGRAGAWTVTYPSIDGLDLPDDGPSAGVKMSAAYHQVDRDSRTWGGVEYRSRLERDVALVLATRNVRFESEVPYKKILTTDRAWTCDFVAEVQADSGVVRVAIECTGRIDARTTIGEKVEACKAAGITLLVIDSANDLLNLLARLREVRERAEKRDAPERHPWLTANGRWVDPRGVKPLSHERPVPWVPAAEVPPPAPVLPTPEELNARRLAQAEDALFEQEYEAEKAAVAAFREQYRAEVAARKAARTEDEQARALAAALRARDERERPYVVVKPGHDDEPEDDDVYDPELADILRDEGCDDGLEIAEGEV